MAGKAPGPVNIEHGIVYSLPHDRFGYFGWPSLARIEDGTLVVAASGFRTRHKGPAGRIVLLTSTDEGRTWSDPRVVFDSPFDDRDPGVVWLGGRRLFLCWATSVPRVGVSNDPFDADTLAASDPALARASAGSARKFSGSWAMASNDGGETWTSPLRVPVQAPKGPTRLRDGSLLYMGKKKWIREGLHLNAPETAVPGENVIELFVSRDARHWEPFSSVPGTDGNIRPSKTRFCEPNVLELPSGRLIAHIRENAGDLCAELGTNIWQTESDDGGKTWARPRRLGFHGAPSHLLRHSSGTLISTYGYRQRPFGERVALSTDDGRTWQGDHILRDDGPSGDLGYPASVELSDGRIFSVYYQQLTTREEKQSLLWTRWELGDSD